MARSNLIDHSASDDKPKLAERDFLEFARETTLRARRYGVRGVVADKEVINAASGAANAWAEVLAQLKLSYDDVEAQVSALVKSIPDDLSIPRLSHAGTDVERRAVPLKELSKKTIGQDYRRRKVMLNPWRTKSSLRRSRVNCRRPNERSSGA